MTWLPPCFLRCVTFNANKQTQIHSIARNEKWAQTTRIRPKLSSQSESSGSRVGDARGALRWLRGGFGHDLENLRERIFCSHCAKSL